MIDRKSKLHLSWDGPFQVVGTKNRHVYVIQRPNTKDKKETHGRRLKRHCGAQDGEHAELVSAAVSKEGECKAERILSWRHQKNSATVDLEVLCVVEIRGPPSLQEVRRVLTAVRRRESGDVGALSAPPTATRQ